MRVLTPAEENALYCSLTLLSDEHQRSMQFWGKVTGMERDYLIVQGMGPDALSEPVSLFSLDSGNTWHLMPYVTEDDILTCKEIRGPYNGDAGYGYTVGDIDVKEATRLACFLKDCDYHCAVAPRGAFVLDESGSVRANDAFSGVSIEKAGRLTSYLHKRKPESTNLLIKEFTDGSVDCMPSINTDIPKGVWRMRYDSLLSVVVGTSLYYQGAVFYHKPESPVHGYYYFGDAQPNHDLAAML
ncbi:radial spoke protein Ci-RSP9 [Diplonema papillatum]|nr:radial spoke protein Ci-RSP9 [Diplonema papillatum]